VRKGVRRAGARALALTSPLFLFLFFGAGASPLPRRPSARAVRGLAGYPTTHSSASITRAEMDDLSGCALCSGGAAVLSGALGPLLAVPGAGPGGGGDGAVHRACALWSPEVREKERRGAAVFSCSLASPPLNCFFFFCPSSHLSTPHLLSSSPPGLSDRPLHPARRPRRRPPGAPPDLRHLRRAGRHRRLPGG